MRPFSAGAAAYYDTLVADTAERAAETGMIDLVALADAGRRGFDVAEFQADVEHLADVITYLTSE